MTFESTEIVDRDGARRRGNLTIKDVTKPIDLTLDYLGVGTDPLGRQPGRLRGLDQPVPQGVGHRLQHPGSRATS